MALGSHLDHSPRQNLPNATGNMLIGDSLRAFTKSNNSLALTFCTLTPTLIIAIIFVLGFAISSTNDKFFKQFIKVYLETRVQLLTPTLGLTKPYK